jgi:hypothetical protein
MASFVTKFSVIYGILKYKLSFLALGTWTARLLDEDKGSSLFPLHFQLRLALLSIYATPSRSVPIPRLGALPWRPPGAAATAATASFTEIVVFFW